MGRSATKGPEYGSKCVLFTASISTIGPSVTDSEIFQIDLPSNEDWYITRVAAYCTNQGNAGAIDVEDDGASVLAANITLVTNDSIEAAVVADPGEEEGKRVAAGSVMTVDATDGATTAIANLTVTVEGYRRRVGAPL